MDPKVFAATFVAVFAAELGDKTQLATFAFAAGQKAKWTVFFAAAAALVCTSALAVVAAEAVQRFIPVAWLHRGAGVLFVVLGALLLWRGE